MLWFVALILSVVVIGPVCSQPASQPPPVTDRENGKPPQPQADNTKQQTTPDERGSVQSPLFVQVLPTKKTNDEAGRDEQERKEKSFYDEWTLRVAIAGTAIFLLQLVAFGLQARRLKQTEDYEHEE